MALQQESSWFGNEVELTLLAAGFVVGREVEGHMVSVERVNAKIWMDSGDTIRYAWDPASIAATAIFFDVMETIEGRERRQLMQSKIEKET